MHKRNIAILGATDAGKTTLTDIALFLGEDDNRANRGSVDKGTTLTDTGLVEIKRGITINSVPASAVYSIGEDHYQLTFVDTPGHPEFGYQVKTVLDGVEGAILLVDVTRGFRNYTAELLALLKESNLPTVVALNKIDMMRNDDTLASRITEIQEDMQRMDIESKLLCFQDGIPREMDLLIRPDGIYCSSESRDAVRIPSVGGIDDLLMSGEMPALLTSGYYGSGIPELITLAIQYIPSPPASKQDAFAAKILNQIPRKGNLRGSAVVRVMSGEAAKGKRVVDPETGQTCKLTQIYDVNGRPVSYASAGDVVLVGGLNKTKCSSGHTLCEPGSENKFPYEKPQRGFIQVEIAPKRDEDLVKSVKRLRSLCNWDPSWSYGSVGGKLMAFSSGRFHLEILLDVLDQEYGIRLNVGKFTPNYVAMPKNDHCYIHDGKFTLQLRKQPTDDSNVVSVRGYAPKLSQELWRTFSNMMWLGCFPMQGFEIHITSESSRYKVRSGIVKEAIVRSLQSLSASREYIALHEPYMTVDAYFKSTTQQMRALDFYKRLGEQAVYLFRDGMHGDSVAVPLHIIMEHEVHFRRALKDVNIVIAPYEYRAVPENRAKKVIAERLGQSL